MPGPQRSPLRAFLANPRRPPGTLTYHELQGFLFAVACAPDLVRPSEWMPVVFGDHGAEYESLEEAQAIIGELMALYNLVNAGVFEDRAALPADCRFRREPLANLEPDAPIAQWSRGFLQGHLWLEDEWKRYVPKALDDEHGATLMALTFFASKDLAEAFHAETGGSELAKMATTIRRLFRDAMGSYAHLGRSIQQALSEEERRTSQPVSSKKVGRNDACPCGSGRKYKKCCGAPA